MPDLEPGTRILDIFTFSQLRKRGKRLLWKKEATGNRGCVGSSETR
jgi:hypothetical protein